MDVLTPGQRHKNMSHIRSKGTKAEVRLQKALWHLGLRYRKNYKQLPGKPDIAITRFHIAIFVDGDFWHGRDLERIKKRIDVNKQYWVEKLQKNIERDQYINDLLTEEGWIVLRFWASDVEKNLDSCLAQIMVYIRPANIPSTFISK